VQAPVDAPDADRATQRRVVEAFLAASRGGDFAALVDLLDPDAVVRADAAAVRMGSAGLVSGAAAVAGTFSGRAQTARLALLDGYAAALWAIGGAPKVVFGFTVEDGRIVEIELMADPDSLRRLDLEPIEA
jgi:RNA polymerase sigma-70 factor (ECF subfamily)